MDDETQRPCRAGKENTAFLQASSQPCITTPTSAFDARSNRETSLLIRGDPKNVRSADVMQIKGTAQQYVLKPFSHVLTSNTTAGMCLQVCVSQPVISHHQKH